MSALSYLHSRGFHASKRGDKLTVYPEAKITSKARAWIIDHRDELLAELAALIESATIPADNPIRLKTEAWLDAIGETDPATRAMTIHKSVTNLRTFRFIERDARRIGLALPELVQYQTTTDEGAKPDLVDILLGGLSLLPEDRKYIKSRLAFAGLPITLKVTHERATGILNEYRRIWMGAYNAEPDPMKRNNVGRRVANSWLRDFLTDM